MSVLGLCGQAVAITRGSRAPAKVAQEPPLVHAVAACCSPWAASLCAEAVTSAGVGTLRSDAGLHESGVVP